MPVASATGPLPTAVLKAGGRHMRSSLYARRRCVALRADCHWVTASGALRPRQRCIALRAVTNAASKAAERSMLFGYGNCR